MVAVASKCQLNWESAFFFLFFRLKIASEIHKINTKLQHKRTRGRKIALRSSPAEMQCSQVALHGKLHSTHIYYGLTRAIEWRGLIERLVHHEWMYGHWIHNLTGSQISYMSLVASADNSFYRWIALLLHPIIQCSRCALCMF